MEYGRLGLACVCAVGMETVRASGTNETRGEFPDGCHVIGAP